MKKAILLLFTISSMFSSCKKDEHSPVIDDGGIDVTCDTTFNPVVMCHGLLASGDTYASQVKRFTQNNYCGNSTYVFDWNTLGGGSSVDGLDDFIDDILSSTGAEQVELVGHSAGGGLGYDYLADATRAGKVAHYVHLGSSPQTGSAGPNGEVPTLNIYSPYDAVVDGEDIPGATNVSLDLKDHYEVATSLETFSEMFKFFRGEAPSSTVIVSDEKRRVCGKVLTLGENEPLIDATVNVYKLNSGTGERLEAQPLVTYMTDGVGDWGSFNAEKDAHYEFEVISANAADRKLHYYREPFLTSDGLVYLRAFPPTTSLAGTLLASLPEDDNQAVVISFTSSQAVINNRDVMTTEGYNLSTAEFASEDNTTIAYFLYDDGNSQTDETEVGLFGFTPFLTGVDVFFPTDQQAIIDLNFNQRELHVPSWPSETEGVTVAVFD
ncbi:MAG: pimeloyl-ACP methyl ester carboxylesterase [Bacteroidia bacterium]|jgi:pimeloyl-ACP methyl ester carboxylesterase